MDESIFGWILDESINPGTKLKQGDLIRFEREEAPLKKEGIIVTADCDLENRKHAKLVTLIPVVSIKALMENYLLIEDCDKKNDQIRVLAFKAFKIEGQDIATGLAILEEHLKAPPTGVRETDILAAKLALGQLDSIPTNEYQILMQAIKSSAKKTDDLSRQIKSRGDILVLPDAKKMGLSGEVAWVRHIWQVPVRDIAIRTSETKVRPGERVARLDSPFRYRLTQLMAQVFSDIGLPDFSASIEEKVKEAYGNA